MQEPAWPPLKPLFARLAQVHPDWEAVPSPRYRGGVIWWAIDTGRDADRMTAYLELQRAVIATLAGLGWGYTLQETPQPTPGGMRWAEVQTGRGKHRAHGPTDLHALLAALVTALEEWAAYFSRMDTY